MPRTEAVRMPAAAPDAGREEVHDELPDELDARRARGERDFGHIDEAACRRFQASVEFIGRKWNAAILLAAVRGARRFSDYRRTVTGISDRLLAARLKELELEGLIERHVLASTPVTVQYTPTTTGLRLLEMLQPLVEWSLRDADADAEPASPPAAAAG